MILSTKILFAYCNFKYKHCFTSKFYSQIFKITYYEKSNSIDPLKKFDYYYP